MSIFSFIKSKLSILDVTSEYVQLKRAGGYLKGPCPFHQETDASFTVSPDKQIFYCFGCHAGGDLIEFIAKIENMSPMEAVQHLVEKYQLEVPEDLKGRGRGFSQSKSSGKKEQFFKACQETAVWCHEQLMASRNAQEYLAKRHIDLDEQKRFMVGYFPGGVRSLNKFLKDIAKKNVLAKDLVAANIIAQGRTSLYSSFEERILFPIRDSLGRCCGFGGRVFGPHDERAKYYNSKESEWFSKGTLLFGFDLAKKEMHLTQRAFLVEGYTDCVAMVKHGYKNTVATLGTACTTEHLKVLGRQVKVLYVLYDGDAAGQKAILRLTRLCWEANLDLQIITLPSGHDPASFLESGGDIVGLVEQSCDIFTFFISTLGERFWGKSLAEKVDLSGKIIEVVAKISDRFKQDLLLQQAASAMQIPFESLKLLLRQYVKKGSGVPSREANAPARESAVTKKEGEGPFGEVSPLEAKIAALVINGATGESPTGGCNPRLKIEGDLLPYFSPPVRSVLEKVERFVTARESGEVTGGFDKLISYFDGAGERDWVMSQSFMIDEEDPEQLFETLLFRFRKQNWKRIIQDIKRKIMKAKRENDKDTLEGLLSSFLVLKQEMKQRGLM